MTAEPKPSPLPLHAARLAPVPFAIAIIAVYALSFLSQTLLSAPVTDRVNVWPFVLVQAVLIAAWIVLHRRRLHDAGRPTGLVIGVAAIYVIEVVLLVLIIYLMLESASARSGGASTDATIFQLFVFLYLLALMTGDPTLGALQMWMIGFSVILLLPVGIAIFFSIWAATRLRLAAP